MKKILTFPLSALTVMLIFFLGGNSFSQESSQKPIQQTATLSNIRGVVNVKTRDSLDWEAAAPAIILHTGDSIATADNASATLTFFDGSQTTIYANTLLKLTDLRANEDGSQKIILIEQLWGKTLNRVKRLLDFESRYEIKTPTSVTAVRGTEFVVSVSNADGATQVDVIEGIVEIMAQEITVPVHPGESASVAPSKAPLLKSENATPDAAPDTKITPTPEKDTNSGSKESNENEGNYTDKSNSETPAENNIESCDTGGCEQGNTENEDEKNCNENISEKDCDTISGDKNNEFYRQDNICKDSNSNKCWWNEIREIERNNYILISRKIIACFAS